MGDAPVRRAFAALAVACATAGLTAPAASAGPDATLQATVGPAGAVPAPRPGPTTLRLRISLPEAPQPSPWTTLTLTLDPALRLTAQPEGATIGSQTSGLGIGTTGFPQAGGQRCAGSGPITQAAAGGYGIRFQTTTATGCAAPMDYTLPATAAFGATGTTLTVTTPAELRHPVAGIDAVVDALDLHFDSGVALSSCPAGGQLTFVATLVHEDGFSGSAGALVPCRPALQPLKVTPRLTLRAARHRDGRVLGELLALRAAPGLAAGIVELRCDVGCAKQRLGKRTLTGHEHAPLLTLAHPLRVTAKTRVSVRVTDADGRRAAYAYKFVHTEAGLVARTAG